ncbi:MAG: FkbM family methyltransferase [Anderseniella sp.]
MTRPPKKRNVPVVEDVNKAKHPPFEHQRLLETSWTKWQKGEWTELAAIPMEEISEHTDRAKVALLIGAAKAQLGDTDEARVSIQQARAWGCNRGLIARVITSTIHNSLGRIAVSLENDSDATRHFEAAFSLVETGTDTPLLARTRRVRETARMGLLPDAAKIIGEDMRTMRAAPVDHSARLDSMRTELDLLSHELSLSLRRGQIMNPGNVARDRQDNLAARAVSQLGQDLWVIEQTDAKRNGFFVEFGATDGVLLSNTWLLETEFDWTGICAEPNPVMFEQLRANRRCMTSSACIGGVSGQDVEFILANAFGGIADYATADHHAQRREDFRRDGKTMRVTTVSLEDFLIAHDAPREIDYLSIDTEGSEYEILRHFPFDQWSIRLITVEHNRTPMRESIRQLLEPLGYHRTEVEFDDWYSMSQKT